VEFKSRKKKVIEEYHSQDKIIESFMKARKERQTKLGQFIEVLFFSGFTPQTGLFTIYQIR